MTATGQPLGTRQRAVLAALKTQPRRYVPAAWIGPLAGVTDVAAHQAARSLAARGLVAARYRPGGKRGRPRGGHAVWYRITKAGMETAS